MTTNTEIKTWQERAGVPADAQAVKWTGIEEYMAAEIADCRAALEAAQQQLSQRQRDNLELIRRYDEQKLQEQRLDTALQRAKQPDSGRDAALMYTCIGKGGEYELIGTATGAGTMRLLDKMRVYRSGNRLYFRTMEDFDARMQRIDTVAMAAQQGEQAPAAKVAMTDVNFLRQWEITRDRGGYSSMMFVTDAAIIAFATDVLATSEKEQS